MSSTLMLITEQRNANEDLKAKVRELEERIKVLELCATLKVKRP